MRVALYAPADNGCRYYRLAEPARVLAGQGAPVSFTDGRSVIARENGFGKVVMPFDVLVLQRSLNSHTWKHLIPAVQAHGIAVVVEIDDDFASIHPHNPAFVSTHKRMGDPDFHGGNTLRCAAMADLVTVTTPALAARYAPHGRVRVLPNYMPRSATMRAKKASDGGTVGWTGVIDTHPHDLETMGRLVGRVLQQNDGRWYAVGDPRTGRLLGIPEPLRGGVSWVDGMAGYYRAVASLDVGVVPLRPCKFNEAKSGLKFLEYAALGVFPIVAPTPDNLRLADTLHCRVARTDRDWRTHIRWALTHRDDAAALATENQIIVRDNHTYERHAHRWWGAWEQALINRKGRADL